MLPYGFQTKKIQPYDEELIQKLRTVYEGGLPASILLLRHGMSNGYCYDRALLIAEALQDGNIQFVYVTIDGIRLNPKVEQDNPMYADYCFLEQTTKDGRHIIYDTSMGLVIDKSLYWLLEHPKVRKINFKAELAKFLDTKKQKPSENDDEYIVTFVLPILEMYYENQDEWYAKPGIELLQREVEQFKKKNHYEQLVKDLREDMASRDSKQKILKNK